MNKALSVNSLLSINDLNINDLNLIYKTATYFKEIINRNVSGNNIKSALDLCMMLLEKKLVVSVSGESFGANNNIRGAPKTNFR